MNRKTKKQIHYYVHGRGHGHATRALEIFETLEREDWQIRVFAGRDAFDMIRKTRPVESVDSLLPREIFRLGARLVKRVSEAKQAIKQDSPGVIVSDGDLPSILAAGICRLPVIAVGHAEVFGETRRPTGVPRVPWFMEKIGAKMSSVTATRHIAVNFVKTAALNDRTVVAGPAVNPIRRVMKPNVDAVCYFRDENGDKALTTLVEMGLTPRLFSRSGNAIPGVRVEPIDRRRFQTALGKTRLVVASAGSQLISECVVSGIPIFALYKKQDAEQRINTAMLRATGIGDGTSFEAFRPEQLRAFIAAHGELSNREEMLTPESSVDAVLLEQIETLLAKRTMNDE